MIPRTMCLCVLIAFSTIYGSTSDGDFLIRAEVWHYTGPPLPPDILSYDDGCPSWITWAGTYRAVWFGLSDFYTAPYPYNTQLFSSEMWFYHLSEFPWDTSEFSCELWSGDEGYPICEIASVSGIAQQYSAVTCQFNEQPYVPEVFWIILNTEQSTGGWPSNISDGTIPSSGTDHSYFSNDFIIWEPWTIQGSTCYPMKLESQSWGSLKNLFN